MKKMAIAAMMAGALGLSAIAAPAPAEARIRGFGPALGGGLVAGAIVGGLASSAYAWGPGYGYGPDYYDAGYYGGPYAYDYDYDAPYQWGGGYATTTYYSDYAPAYYGYRYRRVVRPAFAYYSGAYPGWHHRWHRHW